MWKEYISVNSLDEALRILAEQGARARIVAGATDLLLEMERGVRKGIETLIDITRLPGLDRITLDEDNLIHIGPLVTHNHCVASRLVVDMAFPLAQAAWEVGAPQIRNRGTIAGNLITASPANDTISPLMAMGAQIFLQSSQGKRVIPLERFYTGVRGTVMHPDELLVDIAVPALEDVQRGMFFKLGLRRAQAISVINVAVLLTFDGIPAKAMDCATLTIKRVAITLGAVAPTIIHAVEAEQFLAGKVLDPETIEQAARLAMQAARPIGDVRSSADYRREMIRVCTGRALRLLSKGEERSEFPRNPVLLWGRETTGEIYPLPQSIYHHPGEPILTRINGKEYCFTTGHHKNLLRLLREEAGLTGTKEGCGEGECGACTVYLDGIAVMSCLVPAPRAHIAEIITIEGLEGAEQLHPVQQAFIDDGAVQCGYCTPGFLMSAAKLLEERSQPTRDEIRQAITGNLCRCTGYYKIIQAIEHASQMEVENG